LHEKVKQKAWKMLLENILPVYETKAQKLKIIKTELSLVNIY
jgi:hypothetical protein